MHVKLQGSHYGMLLFSGCNLQYNLPRRLGEYDWQLLIYID